MARLLRVCVLASALTYAVTPPGLWPTGDNSRPATYRWLLQAHDLCSDSSRPVTYRWLLQACGLRGDFPGLQATPWMTPPGSNVRDEFFWSANSSPVIAEATVKSRSGPALCFYLSTFCSAFLQPWILYAMHSGATWAPGSCDSCQPTFSFLPSEPLCQAKSNFRLCSRCCCLCWNWEVTKCLGFEGRRGFLGSQFQATVHHCELIHFYNHVNRNIKFIQE